MSVKRKVAYELHKPVRLRYPRRNVVSKSYRDLFQADLCQMTSYADDNDGYNYILTIIDVFSKFGFARKLKTKASEEVANAFRDALKSCPKKFLVPPLYLQTDAGLEFFGSAFKKMLKTDFKPPIKLYSSQSNLKASVCE